MRSARNRCRRRSCRRTPPTRTWKTLVWEQLRTCYDPEIPINIVDLGLIYECTAEARRRRRPRRGSDDDADRARLRHGRGARQDVKDKLEIIPTISEARVELVFDPPWNRAMMSEAARLQTGMY